MKPLVFLMLCAAAAPLYAQDDAVLPYRPSVSSPAQLPVPGQLEFETGFLNTRSSDSRRGSLPYTFKLAFNEQWGVLVGGEGYVSEHDDGSPRQRGIGDTTFVLKRAFLIDDATALGLELGAKAPTAKDTIGSGKSDYSINGILSRDFGDIHMDANLNATRLGAYDAGTGRTQTGWSASFSVPVAEKWSATGELSGTHRENTQNTAQLLVAAAYSPNKRLVFDFGVAHGMTSASQDWSLFGGVTLPLAKLW
ncbi:transporter [Duganella aquatilis]|nr:transporter [Duganella aquatilis]